MKLSVVAVALVACSSPARPPEPVRPAVVPAAQPAAAIDAPIPTMHTLREVAVAPHAGAIQMLALSPDGGVALSVDELGGVRLWPALDGTKEPCIVDMPRPEQLAIGTRAGGFFAAGRDEAGGLYLGKLDEQGRQLSHVSLAAEPAVTWIAMTERGLLAWRTDQTLALLDVDGVMRSRLASEPAQRIVAVAASGPRAIVLLERDGKRKVRWLSLAPQLAWGAWIDLDKELAGDLQLALAPGGKRLGVLVRTERNVEGLAFDLATGHAIASTTFNSLDADLGFADDDHVAIGGFDGLAWLDLTAPKEKQAPLQPTSPGTRTEAVLAAGGGHAVTAMNGELALSTPTGTQFLGYETVSPRIAEVGPDGTLVVGVADHLLQLDTQLRGATAPLAAITGMVAELRWLGEDDWLVESSMPNDGTLQIAIVDAAGGKHVVRTGLKEVQILDHEPSTQLVTLSFGASSEVARFERKRSSLDHVAHIAKPSPYEQVIFVPVAPALAHGTQLVQVTMREGTTIKWLRDPRALDKPSATAKVDGPFAGADAAGHVYAWRTTPTGQLELVVYADGKLLRTLPNKGAFSLWPEPAGARFAEVAPGSVALYDLEGTRLWGQQLAGVQEVLWLTDGTLAITSAGGVARLDPASGEVTAARCGWRFGLAAKPHPATPRVEPLCSQLRR